MNNLKPILSNFKDRKILVVGDVMLDKYLEGSVFRISPEGPVPVVKIEKEFCEVGGAGNVAANVASLGNSVELFSFAGDDSSSQILKELLTEKNVKYHLDLCSITIEKTRIIEKSQQIARFDKEDVEDKIFSDETKRRLHLSAREAKLIIISDYAKGAITEELMRDLSIYKNKIIVDPKPQNKHFYKGVFLIKPNEKEMHEMYPKCDAKAACIKLQNELGSNVLMTRGAKGMLLLADGVTEIPTYAREVFDVSGAGDTVIAALASSISAGASLQEAAIIANHAAGIVVEKKGTYIINYKELNNKISENDGKIVSFEKLGNKITDLKRKNKKVIWTNGIFDLLHVGHVRYLKKARELGDILIVGINSDESTRKLKGKNRPIQTADDRAEILSSLKCVDFVIIFPELTVDRYVSKFKPEVFVKGGDYSLQKLNEEERKAIEGYNGEIRFIPFIEGRSSTNIIKEIENNENQ